MVVQTRYFMVCELTRNMVQFITCPTCEQSKVRIVECLDRNEVCYGRECAFTTDGAEVPIVVLEPSSSEFI